jgi:hypothetical protein
MHLLAYWTDHVMKRCQNLDARTVFLPLSLVVFLLMSEYTDASVWPLIFALISSFVCRKNLSCPTSPHLYH